MKTWFVAATMAAVIAPSISTAQTTFDVPGLFARVDTDRDGRITPAEIRPDSGADFDRYDLDGNGLLSRDEVRKQQLLHAQASAGSATLTPAILEQVTANAFVYFDFDQDGRVTREDYIQRGISQLLEADFNRDGVTTREELHRFHRQTPR
ncbi:conserved exported hypothetical protein [Luteimonas sp. 9C]|uniref:EF-hand domain-containing protein n=1 Tax=Luteimonas sp. 9C TaxID=2653148 RepID=UPI0012F01DD0|nr:EF-hand domain-containing protein [Luteimonas sp. 9C]VXB05512.1 conserved exported hypothetical protein [Luteimonas sp. 9C]